MSRTVDVREARIRGVADCTDCEISDMSSGIDAGRTRSGPFQPAMRDLGMIPDTRSGLDHLVRFFILAVLNASDLGCGPITFIATLLEPEKVAERRPPVVAHRN